jgi:hypothetical protein
MEKQRKPECVIEKVPEDPSHPDGLTTLFHTIPSRFIELGSKSLQLRWRELTRRSRLARPDGDPIEAA